MFMPAFQIAYVMQTQPIITEEIVTPRKGYIFAPRLLDSKYASPTAAQAVLLAYSEVMFNLAEAREKGIVSIGDAATYYKNGIAANFSYWASRIPSASRI